VAKVRFSISVDPEDAARIREAAAQTGQDVSAYMSRAALDAAERDARTAAIFADIDARIASAESQDPGPWPPPPTDAGLSAEEHKAIRARWDAFFAEAGRGAA
jgi:hypothetical protein